MEEIKENPIRTLAESLFFEKDEKGKTKGLTPFGGLAYIVTCVSFIINIGKIKSKEIFK